MTKENKKKIGKKIKKETKWINSLVGSQMQMHSGNGVVLPKAFGNFFQVILLLMGVEGITLGFFKAFQVYCNKSILYISGVAFTGVCFILFSMKISKTIKRYIYLGVIGIVVLFVVTNGNFILDGVMDIIESVIASFNLRYQSNVETTNQVLNYYQMTGFLMICQGVIGVILTYSMLVTSDVLLVFLVEFPLFMVVLFAGSNVSGLSLLLITMHYLGSVAENSSFIGKPERLHTNPKEEEVSCKYFLDVKQQSGMVVILNIIISLLVCLYLVMPFMPEKFSVIEKMGAKMQNKVVRVVVEYLPVISNGKWSLKVQTAGGGIEDGTLGDVAGYALTNMDDIIVTTSIEPKETVYLKGYIGSVYEKNKWSKLQEKLFDNASLYWHTQGDAKLYVNNLPFLRQLYEESKNTDQNSQMGIMKVQNIHASDKFTFVPYCAYLNGYYSIQDAEGSVAYQSQMDNEFQYYRMSDYVKSMLERNQNKTEYLDQVESEYNAFVKQNYLWVPQGLDWLQEECDKQKMPKDPKANDMKRAITFVTSYLVKNQSYNLKVPKLPKNQDFVKYFLEESKEGYSAHFASSAVVMFRMLHIPARYVTGYAAPENLFTQNADGSYTALLQSDNSHAWVEIYVPQTGWVPVETTPGNIGVLQNIYGVSPEEVEKQQKGDMSQEEETFLAPEELTEEEIQQALEERKMIHSIKVYGGVILGGLGGILLGLYGIRKYKKYRRKNGYDKSQQPNDRALSLLATIHQTMEKSGMAQGISSSSQEFYQWLGKLAPSLTSKQKLLVKNIGLACAFGEKQVSEKELSFLRQVLRLLRQKKYRSFWKK